MANMYQRKQQANIRRQSIAPSIVVVEEQKEDDYTHTMSTNTQPRLSTVSQILLPNGIEYHQQKRLPPIGLDAQQPFLLRRGTTTSRAGSGNIDERRVSIGSRAHTYARDHEGPTAATDSTFDDSTSHRRLTTNKCQSKLLFILEPIVSGLVLLPIIAVFWICGAQLTVILLDKLNTFTEVLNVTTEEINALTNYSVQSMLSSYFIAEFLLFILYLAQDNIYEFVKRQHWILKTFLLKLHILLLALIYLTQWQTIWILYEQYLPRDWYFELVLGWMAMAALIVFSGHLSDVVCIPFVTSYDSVEHCLQFGCPLLTREMSPWKINLINYVVREVCASTLVHMTWYGFFHAIDEYIYPDDLTKSVVLSFLIGYGLYFLLMYFQAFLENLNTKYEFWVFVSINFPQFYRNIRHFLAFLSCIFIWRGYLIVYTTYMNVFEQSYQTYVMLFLISFLVLALAQTASSTIGPLSGISDESNSFPLYPNYYVSLAYAECQRWPAFQSSMVEETKL